MELSIALVRGSLLCQTHFGSTFTTKVILASFFTCQWFAGHKEGHEPGISPHLKFFRDILYSWHSQENCSGRPAYQKIIGHSSKMTTKRLMGAQGSCSLDGLTGHSWDRLFKNASPSPLDYTNRSQSSCWTIHLLPFRVKVLNMLWTLKTWRINVETDSMLNH